MSVDPEYAAKTWLASMTGATGYFEVPRQDAPQLPCFEVMQVGGTQEDDGTEVARLSLVVYGSSKFEASTLARSVSAALVNGPYPVDSVPGCRILGGGCDTVTVIPGTDTAKRYSVSGFIQMRQAA